MTDKLQLTKILFGANMTYFSEIPDNLKKLQIVC